MRPAEPYVLGNAEILRKRLQRLNAEHVRPINALVRHLRREHPGIPFVDPLYEGTEARVLILMEAANLFRFVAAARIGREDLLSWNAVPWPSERLTADERAAGVTALRSLLDLLPRLRVVIPMGRRRSAAGIWRVSARRCVSRRVGLGMQVAWGWRGLAVARTSSRRCVGPQGVSIVLRSGSPEEADAWCGRPCPCGDLRGSRVFLGDALGRLLSRGARPGRSRRVSSDGPPATGRQAVGSLELTRHVALVSEAGLRSSFGK